MRESVTRRGIAHSPRADDELRDLVIMGLHLKVPTYQIAEDLNITQAYIHSVAVNAGISVQLTHIDELNNEVRLAGYTQQSRKSLEVNLVQRIQECIAQDMRMWQIAKELKCVPQTIRNIMKRNNIESPNHIARKRIEQIRNQYKLGARICDLAKEYGITSGYINNILGDIPRHQTKYTFKTKRTIKEVIQNLTGKGFI